MSCVDTALQKSCGEQREEYIIPASSQAQAQSSDTSKFCLNIIRHRYITALKLAGINYNRYQHGQ